MRLDPLGDGISSVEYVDHMGDDQRVVRAARVSLAGDQEEWREEKDPRLIRYLLKAGHWSPFEHSTATLMLKVPLFIRSQYVRHRSMSVNEISARYTEVANEFYVPQAFRAQAVSNRQASVEADGLVGFTLEENDCWYDFREQYIHACETAIWNYELLLKGGVTREQARAVLPQAMYTRFYFSGSLRSWLHMIQVRDHEGAQWEAQQVAKAMTQILEPLFPITFREWRSLQAAH